MEYLLAMGAFALGAWLWSRALCARELATHIARQYCDRENIQFLDGTVASAGLAVRYQQGHWRLLRTYHFEFLDAHNQRLNGRLVLQDRQLVDLRLAGRALQH